MILNQMWAEQTSADIRDNILLTETAGKHALTHILPDCKGQKISKLCVHIKQVSMHV